MKPYVYKTTDFGKTWTALAPADGSMKGYAHVVKEDLVNEDLLFVGTELGLWVSLDGGKQWAQYKGGEMPNVAVRDLAIHPRDRALVIATHGRGIWIVDDITPLRSLTKEMLAKEAAFVPAANRRAAHPRRSAAGSTATPRSRRRIPRPRRRSSTTSASATSSATSRSRCFGPDGKKLADIPTSKRRGLSRAGWSMRLKPPRVPHGRGRLRRRVSARASCPARTRSG